VPEPLTVRVRSPQRLRKPGPVVVCSPDPFEGHAGPPEWLIDGLLADGASVVTLESAPDRPLGTLTLWDLVGGMEDALSAAAEAPGADPARVVVLGIAGGTPLAMIGGSRPLARRVGLLLPWSVEIAARRVERSGSNPRDALVRALTELQPLRALAEAPAKPTLLLHAAGDRNGGHDHALSIAMALHLDGRPVESLAVAFCEPAAILADASRDDPCREAILTALSAFAREEGS